MSCTYAFTNNDRTIKLVKTCTDVHGSKTTTTKFNKNNTSITIGNSNNLFEISDLRGSACPEYSTITAPVSTDIEDLCDIVNGWLNDPIPVSASIDTSGLALEVKQDVQIANQGAAGTAAPFGSGMLGWLRGIWDRLDQFNFTGGALDVNATLDTSLLSKEVKQDTQITNQGTETIAPPAGTKILGWLQSIWNLLNRQTFNATRLLVDANITGNTTANKGATPDVNTIALTDVSAVAVASESDRKQVIIVNATNKTIWIYYGTPAVFGTGIELVKGQTIIEDVYTGQITAIMDTGQTGNIEVTEVTT